MLEHYSHRDDIFGQNWFTYPNLYKDVVEKFPSESRFVEVGSWKGRSSAYLAVEIANSNKNIHFYCVDTWGGCWENHDPNHHAYEPDIHRLYDVFIENMKPVEDYYTPVRMKSTDAAKLFENKSLEFVFIDASHEYEDVLDDIKCWFPKVKSGGIIAGHDYYVKDYNHTYAPGVKKAVNEYFNPDDLIKDQDCWIYNMP